MVESFRCQLTKRSYPWFSHVLTSLALQSVLEQSPAVREPAEGWLPLFFISTSLGEPTKTRGETLAKTNVKPIEIYIDTNRGFVQNSQFVGDWYGFNFGPVDWCSSFRLVDPQCRPVQRLAGYFLRFDFRFDSPFGLCFTQVSVCVL